MDDNAMDDFFSIKDKKIFLDEEPDSRDFENLPEKSAQIATF